MIAIDEVAGIFDHAEFCREQLEMERNPRIPLLEQQLIWYQLHFLSLGKFKC